MSEISRREARRAAVFLLYQWDVTTQPLGSLHEGELDELDAGQVPEEVVLDEAVTLAKRYASDDAGRLVNGILGRIVRERAA